jgi:acylphosphatase
MPAYVARRYVLEGMVQGVGCRAQVQEWVEMIGHLSGFVRNLPDGRVEVCVKGPEWRLTDFEDILRTRMYAPVKIARVLTETLPLENSGINDGFVIRRD